MTLLLIGAVEEGLAQDYQYIQLSEVRVHRYRVRTYVPLTCRSIRSLCTIMPLEDDDPSPMLWTTYVGTLPTVCCTSYVSGHQTYFGCRLPFDTASRQLMYVQQRRNLPPLQHLPCWYLPTYVLCRYTSTKA